jgi:5-methylcytosine-specific restriction endonuclease McrA
VRRSSGGAATRPALGRIEWKQKRAHIKQRDGNVCRCGSTYRLAVHHRIPARYGGTDDDDNLILLCATCHGAAERAFRWWIKHR